MPRLDAGRVAAWRAFGVVAAEMQRKVEAGLVDDYDLPLSWFEILAALQAAGGAMRVGELCEALHELPSSLSRRLDRLEDEGFVSRAATPMPDDRRAVTVSLTPRRPSRVARRQHHLQAHGATALRQCAVRHRRCCSATDLQQARCVVVSRGRRTSPRSRWRTGHSLRGA